LVEVREMRRGRILASHFMDGVTYLFNRRPQLTVKSIWGPKADTMKVNLNESLTGMTNPG